MAGLFRNSEGSREGKYLVQRRDGTVPEWQWFVLGAADPISPWVLRVYAVLALVMGYDRKYARDVWNLASEFAHWRRTHKTGDPDGGKHRKDDPVIVARMRKAWGDWPEEKVNAEAKILAIMTPYHIGQLHANGFFGAEYASGQVSGNTYPIGSNDWQEFESGVRDWRRREFVRSSGDNICPGCNLPYRNHPNDEAPFEFLRVLCRGDRVKL